MSVFISVLKDLWDFILNYFGFGEVVKLKNPSLALLPAGNIAIVTNEAIPKAPRLSKVDSFVANLSYGTKAFVCVDRAEVFRRPVWTIDGVFKRLPYASEVQVLGYEGRFVHISVDGQAGFLLKEDIADNSEDIFPKFQLGEIYSANHPDTKMLREYIKDEFFTKTLFLPLQAGEYAYYEMLVNKRKFIWTEERPRIPGVWQNILKGQTGIQISISPKTSSVIEYLKPNGHGWVGYVKSVHIDESIVVTGVGRIIEGEYSEDTFTKAEWLEMHPVFISVQ